MDCQIILLIFAYISLKNTNISKIEQRRFIKTFVKKNTLAEIFCIT